MHPILSRVTITAILALGAIGGPVAHAQAYPSRNVRIIVPVPPGGGSDVLARLLADKLRDSLGQPFLVENRPGATGNIGTEYVAKSPPDGYTLLLVSASLATNQLLYPQLPFNAEKDFVPIILLGSSPVMMGGSPLLPVASVAEFVAYAKANPGKLTYASCGTGSTQHIAGELLKSVAGVNMVHVPYKGCYEGIMDVIGGHTHIAFNTLANFAPHMKSGKIRGYAVTTAKRSAYAPEVPTVEEAGYPGYNVYVWFGMVAPAGTPREVVARLNAEVNKALARPDVREKLTAQYYETAGGTPEQFAEVIRRDIARYTNVVRDAHIRPD